MRGSDEYPANLVEFIDWFPSDEACFEYLEAVRWPDGFRCPKCRATSFWPVRDDSLKECATCHHQTSATAGTIFEGTRKSLRLWFVTMWLVTAEKNGISAMGLQRELGFSRYEDEMASELLPHVHRVASLLKRWLLGTHQGVVGQSHLDYYLDEFTFRFNRRRSRSRGKLFYRLVQQAVDVDPVSWADIASGLQNKT